MDYLISKKFFKKYSSGTIYSTTGRNNEFYTFPMGISSNVNAISQLEFELAHYDVIVQQLSQYVTMIPFRASEDFKTTVFFVCKVWGDFSMN